VDPGAVLLPDGHRTSTAAGCALSGYSRRSSRALPSTRVLSVVSHYAYFSCCAEQLRGKVFRTSGHKAFQSGCAVTSARQRGARAGNRMQANEQSVGNLPTVSDATLARPIPRRFLNAGRPRAKKPMRTPIEYARARARAGYPWRSPPLGIPFEPPHRRVLRPGQLTSIHQARNHITACLKGFLAGC
jgi:hypothetical protein